MNRLVLACALASVPTIAAAERPLTFDAYAVTDLFKGTPARPILRTREQRMFGTMIREGAMKGPNFAGHYTIASWGCGAGCISAAVIDAGSGAVYNAPFKVFAWGTPQLKYEGPYQPGQLEFEPLSFKRNSRLLIARGCPEENESACASYYYEWTGTAFKLLRKTPAVPARPAAK